MPFSGEKKLKKNSEEGPTSPLSTPTWKWDYAHECTSTYDLKIENWRADTGLDLAIQ